MMKLIIVSSSALNVVADAAVVAIAGGIDCCLQIGRRDQLTLLFHFSMDTTTRVTSSRE